jgi:hypothetical protein
MKTIIQLLAIASVGSVLTNCTAYVDPHVDHSAPATSTTTTTRTTSDPYSPYSSSVTTQRKTTTY